MADYSKAGGSSFDPPPAYPLSDMPPANPSGAYPGMSQPPGYPPSGTPGYPPPVITGPPVGAPAGGYTTAQVTHITTTTNAAINYRMLLRGVPGRVVCPFCQTDVITAVTKKPGLVTWAACGGLCIFGCFLGCCLIPFCVDSLKNTIHTCPSCQHVIYIYQM